MTRRSLSLLCSLLLAGCAVLPPASDPAPAPVAMPAPPVVTAVPVPVLPEPVKVPALAITTDSALRELLDFHERMRQQPPQDVIREINRLNEELPNPRATLQMALLLGQTRNPGDIARALAVLDPLLRSTAPDAAPWQPLARLLAARYTDQRRLEEQIERLNVQARENQRRLDQANEKLEALKAIERSLTTTRPASAPATAPANAPANAPRGSPP